MPTLKDRESTTDLLPANAKSALAVASKPSRWHSIRKAIAQHPQLAQIALFLTIISGTSAVLLCILFKGAWSSHQDNFAILSSIVKMELGGEDSRAINSNSEQLITRTFVTLEPSLEADGWSWINRFGSTMTYGKQDQRLIASCSPYSPLYIICDLSEIP
ncbi:MAG: hypothetical protein WBA76_20770 [Phormidesmis sp.]